MTRPQEAKPCRARQDVANGAARPQEAKPCRARQDVANGAARPQEAKPCRARQDVANGAARPVALVTGATRGLGAAIARRLADEYRVVTTGRSLRPDDGWSEAWHLVGDAADPAHARAVVATIAETCGRLDVLVANAGIACDRPLARISEAAWDRTIAVNLSGVRHLLRAAQPLLLEARGMAILVGSLLGLRGAAGAAAYAASKAGLIGLGLSVAREFAPAARLNIVIPGYLPTAMGLANPEARDRARAEDLLGCDGSIDEAAAMVAFVARLGNVTGQIFHVDGRVAAR